MAESIGSRIRAARLKYGMSQAELARRIGISPNSLNEIEHGRSEPLAMRVEAIARVLQVSTDVLHGLKKAEDEDQDHRRVPHTRALWKSIRV
jgi:transcriptional regulator with XRE-family HTH domain